VLVGVGILALCVWLVLRLARAITTPLRALQHTAERATTGDFGERAPETGPAELAAVAAGFNRLMEGLPRLQQQLGESEARHREMIEKLSRNLPGLIYVSHVEPTTGRVSYPLVGAGLGQLFELDPADVAHDFTPVVERIHPRDRDRVMGEIGAANEALRPFSIEYRVVLPRAGLRHHLSQAHPEQREDGVIVWYGAVVDVTELRTAQQALENANATLEQRIAQRTAALAASNEALESFSYSVAHDLRAPLASIDGFAQGMAQSLRKGDPDRALNYSERVVANAHRMNLLIEGFLALARASRASLVDSPVDQQRLVHEVLAELPCSAAAHVDVAPLPRVRADQATLRQVWQNLLSNALKYSGKRERPVVRVGCSDDGDEVVFWVQDNGAGFDPDYADKLFTPFTRLHKPEEFEGTGVGLALVRRIVERHGGRIWAQSRPGEGATFSFTMPRGRML
jgi:signal transduction histidine kinase